MNDVERTKKAYAKELKKLIDTYFGTPHAAHKKYIETVPHNLALATMYRAYRGQSSLGNMMLIFIVLQNVVGDQTPIDIGEGKSE